MYRVYSFLKVETAIVTNCNLNFAFKLWDRTNARVSFEEQHIKRTCIIDTKWQKKKKEAQYLPFLHENDEVLFQNKFKTKTKRY